MSAAKGLTKLAGALTGAFMLASCATNQPDDGGTDSVHDPIEPVNRAVFAVNDVLDQAVLRPVSYAYIEVVPDPIRDIVTNFLRWLRSPVIFANDLLQGDIDHAGVTAGRFLVNGAFFGIAEAAEGLGLPYRDEDFGQTLGTHGTEPGPYVMLPLLGPSNTRDVVGRVVDFFLDPISYLGPPNTTIVVSITRGAATVVDFRSRNFEQIDDLRENSIDYYARVRAIYDQQRRAAIANGAIAVDDKPDLSKEFEEFSPETQPVDETGATPKTTSH